MIVVSDTSPLNDLVLGDAMEASVTDSGASEVQWPGRLKRSQVRRMYENDARGLLDEELIEEVGMIVYMRVLAILEIKEAVAGRVKCPRCAKANRTTIVPRRGHDPAEKLSCEVCGWACTWGEYHRTFQGKQLNAGGAVPAFTAFAKAWERAKTPQQKWLAIDRVIHEFHYSNREKPDEPCRPTGVNFIEGSCTSVVQFLNELSAGTLTPAVAQTGQAWRKEYKKVPWGAAWLP